MTLATGEVYSGGQVRDADGREVVTISSGATSTSTVVAAPTGTAATDTANIQAAIDSVTATVAGSAPNVYGGGFVDLRAGTYVVTGLTLKPMVTLRGAGKNRTRIQLAASSNVTVIKGQNYDALAGTDSITGVCYGAGLIGFTIDGNSANNASGGGVAVYGYANRIDDVRITNCIGIGYVSDSHNTATFGSDLLATGTMESQIGTFLVDRCTGGGIDNRGPSDQQWHRVIVAKNGPASSTTTFGVRNTNFATNTQIVSIHIWGNQHKYGFVTEQAIDAANLEIEGAVDSNLWLRGSGSKIANIDIYPPGAAGSFAIRVGDTAGSIFGAGNSIMGGRMKDCGVFFDKDGGDNTFVFESYWSDNTKTLFTGTPRAAIGNRYSVRRNPSFGPTAALGTLGTLAEIAAMKSDIPNVRCQGYPTGTLGASLFDAANVTEQNLAMVATGRLQLVVVPVVPGDVISTVNWVSGSTAGATLTHLWSCLIDPTTLNVLAVSGDDVSGSWSADTLLSTTARTLASPYTVPASVTTLLAGLVVVGTTMPTNEGHQFIQTGTLAAVPSRSGPSTTTGLTTPASLPNSGAGPVGAISASSSKVPICWLA